MRNQNHTPPKASEEMNQPIVGVQPETFHVPPDLRHRLKNLNPWAIDTLGKFREPTQAEVLEDLTKRPEMCLENPCQDESYRQEWGWEFRAAYRALQIVQQQGKAVTA